MLPYGQGPVCSPQPYVLPVEAAGPVYGYDVGAVYPYELRCGQHLHHGFHVCARKHVFAGRPYDFYIIAQGLNVKDVAEGYVNVRVFLLYGDVARLAAAVGEAPYCLVYCAAEPFVGEGLVQEVYGVEVEPLERVSGMGRGEYDACARGHARAMSSPLALPICMSRNTSGGFVRSISPVPACGSLYAARLMPPLRLQNCSMTSSDMGSSSMAMQLMSFIAALF